MNYKTNFAKQFEATMDTAKNFLTTEAFYLFRNKAIDGYISACFKEGADGICATNVAGIYELVRKYFSKEKAADFSLTALFSGRLNENDNIYFYEMRTLALNKFESYLTKRKSLVEKIDKIKHNLSLEKSENLEYQDAMKLLEKAQSPKIREMLCKVVNEYEAPINELYDELGNLNQSMNKILFGKDSLNPSDRACVDMFIERYFPSKVIKK